MPSIWKFWMLYRKTKPDNYGGGIKHYRTKIYNPISKTLVDDLKNIRKLLLAEFIYIKSNDILMLIDIITYGKPSFLNMFKIIDQLLQQVIQELTQSII